MPRFFQLITNKKRAAPAGPLRRAGAVRRGRRDGEMKTEQAGACSVHRALFAMAAVAFVDRFCVKGSRMLVGMIVFVFLFEIHVANFIPMTALLQEFGTLFKVFIRLLLIFPGVFAGLFIETDVLLTVFTLINNGKIATVRNAGTPRINCFDRQNER
jgi:hypothetical protein